MPYFHHKIKAAVLLSSLIVVLCTVKIVAADSKKDSSDSSTAVPQEQAATTTQTPDTTPPPVSSGSGTTQGGGDTTTTPPPATQPDPGTQTPATTPATTTTQPPTSSSDSGTPPADTATHPSDTTTTTSTPVRTSLYPWELPWKKAVDVPAVKKDTQPQPVEEAPSVYADLTPPAPTPPPTPQSLKDIITSSQFNPSNKSIIQKDTLQQVSPIFAATFAPSSNEYAFTGLNTQTTKRLTYASYGLVLAGLILLSFKKAVAGTARGRVRPFQKFTA